MEASRRTRSPLSTIGRSIDFRIATNAGIGVLSVMTFAAGVILHLVRGGSVGPGLLSGLAWGGSVFLAWALARETDPDRSISAFFAAGGALAGVILLGNPHFLLLFWVLLGLRTVNRSTGEAPGPLDWVGLYGITLWLGFSAHWMVPLLTFPAVFFAGLRRFPLALRATLPLVLPASAVAYGILHSWRFTPPPWNGVEILVMAGGALCVIPVIASYREVESVGDRTGKPLIPRRVRWGLGWAAGAAIILTFSGAATVGGIAPLWAALVGSSVGWATDAVLRLIRHDGAS
ncbi:hypothetical protein ACFLTM_03520 [Candidatus Bipolaricaulota bacterium]